MSRWICIVPLLTLLMPGSANAQRMLDPTGKSCYVLEAEDTCLSVQPVWVGNGSATEGALTLERLTHVAAPILWPSPQEFLLLEYRNNDVPGRVNGRNAGRTVYYRIREVRLKDPENRSPVLRPDDPRIRDSRAVWSNASGDLPIDHLDLVYIAFFFYYPVDRGVGGHLHDIEAMETQIRFQRVCEKTPDLSKLPEAGRCQSTERPSYAAHLESISGSAHGVGWYTNTLRLRTAPDTILPAVVLVEENKHATSPDRDGDGTYMPHYDVNRHTNDAWGVRDVAGSGRVGGAFRTEQTRLVRNRDQQICPPQPSARLVAHYAPLNRGCSGKGKPYELRRAWEDPICKQRSTLRSSSDPAARRLRSLLDGKGFCDLPDDTVVKGPRGELERTFLWVARSFSPGPDGEYGFQNAVQRLSFAYRYDGGHGASGVFPVGHELPFFGGWVVAKMNVIGGEFRDMFPLKRIGYEGVYSPSASRPVDWYIAVGAEGTMPGGAGRREWYVAEEIGARFRFSVEQLKIIRFIGGRVGIRAESLSRPRNVRFVYEFGAGSW